MKKNSVGCKRQHSITGDFFKMPVSSTVSSQRECDFPLLKRSCNEVATFSCCVDVDITESTGSEILSKWVLFLIVVFQNK